MKNLLILGSILLASPAISQAQLPSQIAPKAPSLSLPKASSQTPALDAFAGAKTSLQLQTRWVRINDAELKRNLPAWNKDGAWSHVATTAELRALELMNRTGNALVTDQQLGALNNQIATLSYQPFASFQFPTSSDSGSLDDRVTPRPNFRIVTPLSPPYIPNLAKPDSRAPEMAPMPGIGGKSNSPSGSIVPAPNPYSRPQMSPRVVEPFAYKFQLRPTISGDQIALELRSLDQIALELRSVDLVEKTTLRARADQGQSIVFSLPNIMEVLQSERVDGVVYGRTRRTFLLVTPTVTPMVTPIVTPQAKSESK